LFPGKPFALGAVLVGLGVACVSASEARANDFFSSLFGGFFAPPQTSRPLSYAPDNGWQDVRPARRPVSTGGHQAFCVRTCDGRYFPVQTGNGQSSAASCNSFCPASETKVFYGSTIDHAVSEGGKSYSALPNAFKYRNEIVAGCTCNGKDQFGLARVDVHDDPTLRKGDLVAGADGLMVAAKAADRRGASLKLSPAPASVLARFDRMPVVASD
jgi:hypothetical protein